MLTIRPETIEDQETIFHLTKDAYKQENEARLINEIRNSNFFIPELSLVAEKKQEILGHILFSKISIDSIDGSIPSLFLSTISVKPVYQLQGIGSRLVQEGFVRSGQLDYEHVVVIGSPRFFRKFGFQPAKEKGILPPFKVPDQCFMIRELYKDSLKYAGGIVKYLPVFELV
ncbi:GNAT family N-acetyltransferase [Cytobacillus sp. Hz8]|uniref:GNAT family N-acetyltransferase n=1 Tax=Cytobacillus sp. Hz8 TaxID=3347168 RepID=UPI0035E3235C